MSERQQALKLDFEKKMQKEAEVSAKRRKLQDRNVSVIFDFFEYALNS